MNDQHSAAQTNAQVKTKLTLLFTTACCMVITHVFQEEAKRMLVSPERQLGFSFIRFLPKSGGVRPIVNLKRKPTNHATISVLDNEGSAGHACARVPCDVKESRAC
jgi:hypothetical protein